MKIKNIANRDEGNMESYKKFRKVNDYFRIVEDNSPDSEYYSEENGEDLEKELIKEYKDITHKNNLEILDLSTQIDHDEIINNV